MLSPNELENLGYVSSMQERNGDDDGPGEYLCTLKAVHPLPDEILNDEETMKRVRKLTKKIQTDSREVPGTLDVNFGIDVENNVAMYMGVYASPIVLERIFFTIGEPVIELISISQTEEILTTIGPDDVLFGYHSLSRFVNPPIFIVVPSYSDPNPSVENNLKRIALIRDNSVNDLNTQSIKIFGTFTIDDAICADDDKFDQFVENMYTHTEFLRNNGLCWFVENGIDRERKEYYFMNYFFTLKDVQKADEYTLSQMEGSGIFVGLKPLYFNALCSEENVDYLRKTMQLYKDKTGAEDGKLAIMKYM